MRDAEAYSHPPVDFMTFRLNDSAPSVSRRDLADPDRGRPLRQRLADAGAVDLEGNSRLVDHGRGYGSLEPIDHRKRILAADADGSKQHPSRPQAEAAT